MSKPSTSLVSAITSLGNSSEFSAPISSLSVEEKCAGFCSTYFVEEVAKTRRESLREDLLLIAEQQGVSNEKGGSRLIVGGYIIRRECRISTTPDEKKLMSLLEKRSLAIEQAFDKVTVLQPNPSKITALVESGHLAEAEAKALYRNTYALIVHPPQEVEALLEAAVPPGAIQKKNRR